MVGISDINSATPGWYFINRPTGKTAVLKIEDGQVISPSNAVNKRGEFSEFPFNIRDEILEATTVTLSATITTSITGVPKQWNTFVDSSNNVYTLVDGIAYDVSTGLEASIDLTDTYELNIELSIETQAPSGSSDASAPVTEVG